MNLPLFLHERDSHNDFLDITSNYKGKVVIHCFPGTEEEMKTFINLGYYIGLTGFITDKKRAHNQRLFIKDIPIDKL